MPPIQPNETTLRIATHYAGETISQPKDSLESLIEQYDKATQRKRYKEAINHALQIGVYYSSVGFVLYTKVQLLVLENQLKLEELVKTEALHTLTLLCASENMPNESNSTLNQPKLLEAEKHFDQIKSQLIRLATISPSEAEEAQANAKRLFSQHTPHETDHFYHK